jgi:hypothetical protein
MGDKIDSVSVWTQSQSSHKHILFLFQAAFKVHGFLDWWSKLSVVVPGTRGKQLLWKKWKKRERLTSDTSGNSTIPTSYNSGKILMYPQLYSTQYLLKWAGLVQVIQYSMPRKTRKGWPLMTDETEVNGDSKSTNDRGPSLVGSLGLSCRRYKRFCSALAALVGPVQNIFSSPCAISMTLSHRPASWAGSRVGSPVS